MNGLSVVIITYNEQDNIADCIRSVKPLTDDIIVVDAGSSDNTIELAQLAGANVYSTECHGYGFSRNLGATKAKYNWILSLDADERVSPELIHSIQATDLSNPLHIFNFRRRNYINQKKIRFGTMGADKVTRIYNRDSTKWDVSLVHEKLEGDEITKKFLSGHIDHFCFKSLDDYKTKAEQYARMSAKKYFIEGKKAALLKMIFSPIFNSVKSYVFQLGFLEGMKGIKITGIIAHYSWLKYAYLQELQNNKGNIATNYTGSNIKTSTQTFP